MLKLSIQLSPHWILWVIWLTHDFPETKICLTSPLALSLMASPPLKSAYPLLQPANPQNHIQSFYPYLNTKHFTFFIWVRHSFFNSNASFPLIGHGLCLGISSLCSHFHVLHTQRANQKSNPTPASFQNVCLPLFEMQKRFRNAKRFLQHLSDSQHHLCCINLYVSLMHLLWEASINLR